MEAKGFWAMTSRRRMMSCRAEKRTWRLRGVEEGPAREKPEKNTIETVTYEIEKAIIQMEALLQNCSDL